MEFLEVERELGRRVREILPQDRGVGDRTGRHDVPDQRAPDRVREGLEHRLEAFGRRRLALHEPKGFGTVRCTDHVVAVLAEQARELGPKHRIVIGDPDLHRRPLEGAGR